MIDSVRYCDTSYVVVTLLRNIDIFIETHSTSPPVGHKSDFIVAALAVVAKLPSTSLWATSITKSITAFTYNKVPLHVKYCNVYTVIYLLSCFLAL